MYIKIYWWDYYTFNGNKWDCRLPLCLDSPPPSFFCTHLFSIVFWLCLNSTSSLSSFSSSSPSLLLFPVLPPSGMWLIVSGSDCWHRALPIYLTLFPPLHKLCYTPPPLRESSATDLMCYLHAPPPPRSMIGVKLVMILPLLCSLYVLL